MLLVHFLLIIFHSQMYLILFDFYMFRYKESGSQNSETTSFCFYPFIYHDFVYFCIALINEL